MPSLFLFGRTPAPTHDTAPCRKTPMPTHGRNRPDHTGPMRMAYETNRKIVLATQTICAICGKPVDKTLKSPHPMSPTVDHIIPVTRGGHPSDLDNLQLAHRACNLAKGTNIGATGDRTPPATAPRSKNTFDWKNY